jgi:hypothetical protein
MPVAQLPWENVFSLIDPQINAEGVHTWPFDPACPIEVRFFQYDKRHHIRMNRHDYAAIPRAACNKSSEIEKRRK